MCYSSPSTLPCASLFFFYYYGDHPHLHSFPTRRSSDLTTLTDLRVLGRLTAKFVTYFFATKVVALLLGIAAMEVTNLRSEEHTSELQSQSNLVCRLLLEKKKTTTTPLSRNSNCSAVSLP